MFNSTLLWSTLLWVGLGLLLLIIVILYNTPRAKAAKARRAEEYRRQEEKQKEKERAEAVKKARHMENFRKQRIVVYIREKDGRKSSFEAVLIRMLLKSGITIEPLPENNGSAIAGGDITSLKDGFLALIATSWIKSEEKGDYWENDADAGLVSIPRYTEKRRFCDFRLLEATGGGVGKILGAGCWNAIVEENLANTIVEDLASTIPEVPENVIPK